VNLQVVGGLLLYLGVGVLSDLLLTAYYIFVGKQWATLASLASIPIALLNFWVLDKILVVTPTIEGAILYSIGNAIGCFAIMMLAKKMKEKRDQMPRFKSETEFLDYVIKELQRLMWGNHIISHDDKKIYLDSKEIKVSWKKDIHLDPPMWGRPVEDTWINLVQTECCFNLLKDSYPTFLDALRQSLPSKTIGPKSFYELGPTSPYFIALEVDDQKVFIPGHLICESVDAGLTGEPLVAKVFLSQEDHPIR
jgi:hypothetical protein